MERVIKREQMMLEMVNALEPWFGSHMQIHNNSISLKTSLHTIAELNHFDKWDISWNTWNRYTSFNHFDVFKDQNETDHNKIIEGIKPVVDPYEVIVPKLLGFLPDHVCFNNHMIQDKRGCNIYDSETNNIRFVLNERQWHNEELDPIKYADYLGFLKEEYIEDFIEMVISYYRPTIMLRSEGALEGYIAEKFLSDDDGVIDVTHNWDWEANPHQQQLALGLDYRVLYFNHVIDMWQYFDESKKELVIISDENMIEFLSYYDKVTNISCKN